MFLTLQLSRELFINQCSEVDRMDSESPDFLKKGIGKLMNQYIISWKYTMNFDD